MNHLEFAESVKFLAILAIRRLLALAATLLIKRMHLSTTSEKKTHAMKVVLNKHSKVFQSNVYLAMQLLHAKIV
jgi:hypothetical protein